ncbi:MAG: hypothetical protein WA001_01180 [Patescibacteria group bacterium]
MKCGALRDISIGNDVPANDAGACIFLRACPDGTYEFTAIPAPYDLRAIRHLRLQGWYPLACENDDDAQPAIFDTWDSCHPCRAFERCLQEMQRSESEIIGHISRSRYVAM